MVDMSTGNGHDTVTVQMVDILGKIHQELVNVRGVVGALHEDVIALRAGQTELRNELNGLRVELHSDLEELRSEVHDLRTELREDLGTRVRRLEDTVFKRAG